MIFGHKNGYKVKVGETALQPDSEFQFVVSFSFGLTETLYKVVVFFCFCFFPSKFTQGPLLVCAYLCSSCKSHED